jgi:MFS family permease
VNLNSFLTLNGKLNKAFRALQYRNYRLFFAGQTISLVGTWMQRLAIGWLVYRLSSSALLLGIVEFSGQIPCFILTPLGGVAADRYNKYHLLIITQILSMLQAIILTVFFFRGNVTIVHLICLNIFLGVINAFDMPIRQSFVVEMIDDKNDIGNAIALNSSMVNVARLLGPAAAGFIVTASNEGVCFLLNAVSYIAVIVSLFMMKNITVKNNANQPSAWQQMAGGFEYTFSFAPIKYIIAMIALISLAGMPYIVLMPIFARDILHGGPHTLGMLMSASGIGALLGALYLATRKNVVGLGKIMAAAMVLFSAGIIGFAFSTVIWLSLIFIFLAGLGIMLQTASGNTILQTVVSDEMRGRIMSVFVMAFIGMAPFGSLLAGTLANKIGAPHTLLIGGFCCLVAAAFFARKLPSLAKMIRPVYVQKGLIREVTEGIQSAAELSVPPED